MRDLLEVSWPTIAALVNVAVAIVASSHAVLHKRDSRAALGWVGLIWLSPILGALLYVVFGINRIRRRAAELRAGVPRPGPGPSCPACPTEVLVEALGPDAGHLLALARLSDRVTERPLTSGNRLEPLVDGDEAYPAMIEAIGSATRSIALSTYIFDHDRVGRRFVEALAAATARGVEVRVLVDAIGARYSWPTIVRPLRRRGVPVARFLPTILGPSIPYTNLRNHRKILVVDGAVGFTGGMNLREGHELGLVPKHPVRDMHFRVRGPVVGQMQSVFAEDWAFAAREALSGETWFPPLEPSGPTISRGIGDGPDEDFEKVRNVIHGAIACARRSIRIVTPYFLPDPPMVTALVVAARRAVEVEILLPGSNNLRLVQWASTALLWQVLEGGCRVRIVPGTFDHTKLFVVDGAWSLVGSTNWDPRSLRLNFEFDVECFDSALAATLESAIAVRRQAAREITLAEVDGRRLPVRLRDGVARLAAPYL